MRGALRWLGRGSPTSIIRRAGVARSALLPSRPAPKSAGAASIVRLGLLVSSLGVALAVSCATYEQDLNRASEHYNRNQFESALALFRVLEPDLDSFSAAEQARYAYLRGMTDYRLSGLSPQGTGVSDPRQGYRDNARHWLAIAAAIEKKTPGGLTPEEKQRLDETMADLNRDVFGGGEVASGDGGPAAAADAGAPAP